MVVRVRCGAVQRNAAMVVNPRSWGHRQGGPPLEPQSGIRAELVRLKMEIVIGVEM